MASIDDKMRTGKMRCYQEDSNKKTAGPFTTAEIILICSMWLCNMQVFDLMSEHFSDSRIYWYPRKGLFSGTICFLLTMSVAEI